MISSGCPCAVAQTACAMFPRSKRPVLYARYWRIESAPNPAAYAAVAVQSRTFGRGLTRGALRAATASGRRAPLRSPAPRRRPDRRGSARGPSSGSAARRRIASASAAGSPGGTSSAFSPSRSSSRAAGVSAVISGAPHASAWYALFGITRNALSDVPKIPSAQPAPQYSRGRSSYSIHSTHSTLGGRSSIAPLSCPEPITRTSSSGASRAASRIVSTPCNGISLPTKSTRNGSSGRQPAWKRRSSAPTRHTCTRSRGSSPSSARKSAFASVSATTRSGMPQGPAVDDPEDARSEQPCPEPAPIADERVVERDQRVEDERPLPGHAPRVRHVEVPWIADEDDVERVVVREAQPQLGEEESERHRPADGPVVAPRLEDGLVVLGHLDPRAAQGRDHLRVPRVVPLVGPEVENAQRQLRTSSTSARSRSAAPLRSSWWLVTISLRSPREKNCRPTTTSRTPSVSSGRWPIACPVALSTVR